MSIISIDYFGTLDYRPVFWQELLKFAKLEGNTVCVISGLWPEALIEKLEAAGYSRGVHYSNVRSILSYLSDHGIGIKFDEDQDSWYSDESAQEDWWNAKAGICKSIGSKMHIDSDIRFAKAFENIPTRFVHLEKENMRLLRQWAKDLRSANTFDDDDWEDDYMSMFSGIVPMM